MSAIGAIATPTDMSDSSCQCAPGIGLVVIVLNYRTAHLTKECLRSLETEISSVPQSRVIVVDNASQDGSAEEIAAAITQHGWESWAMLLPLQNNLGFARGNNRAFNEIRHGNRFVLLLNSDTVVHPGSLRHCIEVMESDPTIGLMSCAVNNADGSIQNVARRFPTPARQITSALGLPFRLPKLFGWANTEDPSWDRRTTKRDVQWIGGAFMLARGDMIRQIGLFDDDFFFYGEDIELCYRAWKNGWRVHFDPAVSIVHFGGSSSDPTRLPEGQRSIHRWQARYLVQRKCYGRFAEWLLRVTDIANYALRLFVLRVRGAKGQENYQQLAVTFSLLIQIMSHSPSKEPKSI